MKERDQKPSGRMANITRNRRQIVRGMNKEFNPKV